MSGQDLILCGWCDRRREPHRSLPDGETLCADCFRRLRRETAGYPDCPVCKHRYWLAPTPDGWGFKCLGCGLKFAGHAGHEERPEDWPPYRHPFIDHNGLG